MRYQMAKCKQDPITEADLQEWLDQSPDFAFEQEVYSAVRNVADNARGISEFQHKGTYHDPATGTPREFDIRAMFRLIARGPIQKSLFLAIECKNVAAFAPVVIGCVPRSETECFHYLVQADGQSPGIRRLELAKSSFYENKQPVGKNCSQVRRHERTSEFIDADSGIFHKWSQAISSAHELVSIASRCPQGFRNSYTAVIPVLVVPDGSLWEYRYDGTGVLLDHPCETEHRSYFVGHEVKNNTDRIKRFRISHLEMCSLSGLNRLLKRFLEEFDRLFFDL